MQTTVDEDFLKSIQANYGFDTLEEYYEFCLNDGVMYKTDGYKLDHRRQYPNKTSLVITNATPRKGRNPRDRGTIFFGLQFLLQHYFIEEFKRTFFNIPKEVVLAHYQNFIDSYIGPNNIGTDHIAALHDLGYVPLRFKALPEGTFVPYGVPVLTVENTLPEFFWVVNYFESLVSDVVWIACTSAKTAKKYRTILDKWANMTASNVEFVDFQAHDFSMRGMPGPQAAAISGAAHLLSFTGSDSLPSIGLLKQYYGATGIIAGGIPATEHSVMCAGGIDDETGTYRRLITEVYPSGPVAIVSDTWNLWDVLRYTLPSLKTEIMAREGGPVVIRPDSGDPELILCGNSEAPYGSPEYLGVIQMLWDTFGGTINDKGFKELYPHVNAIYGDSITLDRCEDICAHLQLKGFASTNVVFGVGSFTYQYVTRDTDGWALKATTAVVDSVERKLWKRPITDDGTKTSARGRLVVLEEEGRLRLIDNLDEAQAAEYDSFNMLKTVFLDGKFVIKTTLAEIRELVKVES